jgi:hypothetical protein
MRSTLDGLDEEVAALAAVAVSGLPVAGLQELTARCAGLSSRLAGVGSRALGELQVRGQGMVPDPEVAGAALPTAAWLRTAANVTGNAAGRDIRISVSLRELPAVADAIVDGVLSPRHGQALVRLVGKIEPGALLRSQPQLVEVARRCDPHQLEQYVSHLIATHCPPVLEDEEATAEQRRFLQLRDQHDGSWRGTFCLPNAAMETVLTVLEPLARRDGAEDKRTAGQRRADALTDVFSLALRHGNVPDAAGARPLLTYVVPETPDPADGFHLDLDRHPGQDCATGAWTGPATRDRIATLLCDSHIQRVVLDATGQVVSLESVNESITAAQRRAVAARDRCCVTKGCTRPPAFCDVHHLRARADGGSTTVDNLVLLCRRHHVMWHRDQLDLTDLRVPWKRLPQQVRAPALE